MLAVEIQRDDELPLHDQVAAAIRHDIIAGEVPPGGRLPPARDMAAVLGVHPNTVLRALQRCVPGTHIVWLDQVLPMYRKDAFAIEGVIGMVKSTNHRFRVVTIFRRL